eukprot:NODE_447_length_7292_cov_0.701932.p3 type:complete len:367 gc:universal NODE_447_length_7292_cov_0.701932:2510-3610(+)
MIFRYFSIHSKTPKAIQLKIKDRICEFNYSWLHDHHPSQIHPITNQKNAQPIQLNTPISSIINNQLHLKWPHIEYKYTQDWLMQHHYHFPQKSDLFQPFNKQYITNPSNIPCVDYNELISSASTVYQLLKHLHIHGISFIQNTPPNTQDTAKIATRISFIRPTHYGNEWEFTSDYKYKDTAYSNESLPVHTDTTYFTNPIRLQLFHVLQQANGGDSIYSDGFLAYSKLSPKSQNILTSIKLPFQTSGDQYIINYNPIFTMNIHNQLQMIRWNPNDRDLLNHLVFRQLEKRSLNMDDLYGALHEYQLLLDKLTYQVRLTPGNAIILDNYRILHGRTEFKGKRSVCGAYLNGDDVDSRFYLLHQKYHQ